jgi:hypothetical protein
MIDSSIRQISDVTLDSVEFRLSIRTTLPETPERSPKTRSADVSEVDPGTEIPTEIDMNSYCSDLMSISLSSIFSSIVIMDDLFIQIRSVPSIAIQTPPILPRQPDSKYVLRQECSEMFSITLLSSICDISIIDLFIGPSILCPSVLQLSPVSEIFSIVGDLIDLSIFGSLSICTSNLVQLNSNHFHLHVPDYPLMRAGSRNPIDLIISSRGFLGDDFLQYSLPVEVLTIFECVCISHIDHSFVSHISELFDGLTLNCIEIVESPIPGTTSSGSSSNSSSIYTSAESIPVSISELEFDFDIFGFQTVVVDFSSSVIWRQSLSILNQPTLCKIPSTSSLTISIESSLIPILSSFDGFVTSTIERLVVSHTHRLFEGLVSIPFGLADGSPSRSQLRAPNQNRAFGVGSLDIDQSA